MIRDQPAIASPDAGQGAVSGYRKSHGWAADDTTVGSTRVAGGGGARPVLPVGGADNSALSALTGPPLAPPGRAPVSGQRQVRPHRGGHAGERWPPRPSRHHTGGRPLGRPRRMRLARPARAPAPPPAAIFASGGNQAADQARQTLRAVIAGARSGRTRHSPCPAWAASAAAGLRPCVEWFVGFPHGVRHDTDLARHGNGGSPEAETRHKGQSPHLQC